MSRQEKIPVEIKKITNPDGSSRTGAITFLEEVMSTPDIQNRLSQIEHEYALLVQYCLKTLEKIKSREGRRNALLRWELADLINEFIDSNADKLGVLIINYKDALSTDLNLSDSGLTYIIRFRNKYTHPNQLDKNINWSKYRELLDFSNDKKRQECEELIKSGKITTDAEIRAFKKR